MPVHKIALFGFGRAGTIHFWNILANHHLALVYVVEADVVRAHAAIDEYNQTGKITVLSVQEADKVYSDPEIEGVIIATPTFTHSAIVKKSLQHGKSVFCEKPIAEDLASIKACYEAAEKAGKPLLCSFNRRFDPSLKILKTRVKNNEAGKIHTVKATARDSPLPSIDFLKFSGGMFHDCAIHDIDIICWILGEYPVKVYTQATSHVKAIGELGDIDCAAIVLNFASGIIALIDIDRDSRYGYDQRVEVFGDGGMVISENQIQSGAVTLNAKGIHHDLIHYSFPQRYAQSYVNVLQHFAELIQGKTSCSITKQNTLKVVQIADACLESHRTGLPVQISPNDL